jgi:hypothetical protein
MTRRQQAAAAALAVAAVALVAILLLRDPTEEVSDSFCELYPNITKMTAMLERNLEGEAKPGDLSLESYRSTAGMVWSDSVASGGPDDLDADARRIAAAVRSAAADGSVDPLQAPEVRRAVARVEAGAKEACDGRER